MPIFVSSSLNMNDFQLNPQWILKALDGDAEARHEIFNHTADELMGVTYRYANSMTQAEEWLVGGYVYLFLHWHTRKPGELLRTWMRREMAIFCAKKCFLYESPLITETTDRKLLDIKGRDLSGEEVFFVLKALPISFRCILNLYSVEGFSFNEIAKISGQSPEEVAGQYTRGRLMMAKLLSVPEPLTDRKRG